MASFFKAFARLGMRGQIASVVYAHAVPPLEDALAVHWGAQLRADSE
ncbi:MAG: hypothetical protein IPH54_17910 [Rhodoferax sp.]|nr:hypothetical protein [Rhodoferax sp.]